MKETLQPVHHPIHAKTHIPGSKSISNRALLLAALAQGVSEINNILLSDDIRVLIKALSELGVAIHLDEAAHKVIVAGCDGHFPSQQSVIWCGESGSLARFLLAACASIPGAYYFDAAPALRKRPISSLLKVLINQGVTCIPNDAEKLPFTLISHKGLHGGKVYIDASKTGQGVSALLISAPFAKSPLIVKAENMVSRTYVDITCSMMAEFGVHVNRSTPNEFFIPQAQYYRGREYLIEPDLSTASYFFAAAAVTAGEVTIQKIKRHTTKQGDVVFLTMLEKMGCSVHEDSSGLTVKGASHLQGIEANMRDCPDLFMTLAAIAPFATTPTLITHIGHARFKESDRLASMRKGLEQLGIQVEEGDTWFKIHPSQPHGGIIHSENDHRIAMAFAIIGLRIPNVIIEGTECVAKSCPEFFQLWQKLSL